MANQTSDQARQSAEVAREKAGEVAGTAQQQATEVKDQAKQQARRLSDEAKSRSANVLGQALHEVEGHADGQAAKAVAALRDVSGQLHSMADGAEPGAATDLARQGADQLDELCQRIDDRGMEGVVGDLQDVARRRPGLFLLGAGIAGFAAGRLLRNVDRDAIKSSATAGGVGSPGPAELETGDAGPTDRPGPRPIRVRTDAER